MVPVRCFYFSSSLTPFAAPSHAMLDIPFSWHHFRAFGAPGHIRVSYGSLPEEECLIAIGKLADGLRQLTKEAAAIASKE